MNADKQQVTEFLSHREVAPFIVMAIGVLVAIVLVILSPKAEPEDPAEPLVPVVDWVKVYPMTSPVKVHTQGTVQPTLQIDLVAQVAGRIQEAGDSFAEGGFFAKGDVLVGIEPADYQYALVSAESRVADARQMLATEKGRSKQAKREWRDLGDKESNDLFLRKPQLASAEASLKAAIADRDKAKLNLKRTTITAPFDGRVLKKFVDVGQYVTPGTPIARIYATEKVEVRLPLTNRQAGLVDLPLGWKGNGESEQHPQPLVWFTAELGRKQQQWQGKLVRTEASIDTNSRVYYAVAEVENPFINDDGSESATPMAIGLFVEADIEGKAFGDAISLPRSALTAENKIYLVDDNSQLKLLDVDVLQATAKYAIVRADVAEGAIVVTSHVPYAADGLTISLRQDTSEEDTAVKAEEEAGQQ